MDKTNQIGWLLAIVLLVIVLVTNDKVMPRLVSTSHSTTSSVSRLVTNIKPNYDWFDGILALVAILSLATGFIYLANRQFTLWGTAWGIMGLLVIVEFLRQLIFSAAH